MTTNTTRRFDAILFDLDGTLLDTLADIAESLNTVLRELRLPERPVDEYRMLVGDGIVAMAKRLLPPERATDDGISSFVNRYREIYAAKWRDSSAPYAGIPELLEKLHADGVPLGVLSNKRDDFTKLCVDELVGRKYFKVIRGELPGVPLKPHPRSAIESAGAVGTDPSRCIYVGDSEVDVETARAAGMYSVGVAWGFRGRERLTTAGADRIVERPEEILALMA